VKAGWNSEKLGDVCEIYQPKTISTKEMMPDGDYPVFGANGVIGRYNQYNHENSELLITCRGATCGSVNISIPKSWINGNAMVVRPKTEALDRTYLEYFFRGPVNLSGVITGSAQPQITRQSLAPVKITFPKPGEQKRIVAILDEAFAGIDQAIANTEKNLASAHELFESTLNTIFTQKGEGWRETTLGKICDFQNGFAFKSSDTVEKSNVQLIRMGNLYQNRLDLERKPSFYPDGFATGYERYELHEGDLIMSLTGTVDKEDYGFAVVVPASDKTLLLNQRIAKFINLSDDIHKDYLLYLLRSRMFLDQLYASASGTRQANLSTNKMKEIVFYLPDVPQQLNIVSKIKNLGAETQQLETIYKQKLSALNELKQSLLKKAFSGELTTDDTLAEAAA
jgi:type I restriction enzyme, S subunit